MHLVNLNYPLYQNDRYDFNCEDILIYLSIFNQHHLAIRYKNNSIYSYHFFDDNLELKVTWNINNQEQFLMYKGSIDLPLLLKLSESKLISYQNYEYLSFSQDSIINEESQSLFNFIIRTQLKNSRITNEEYEALEYNIDEVNISLSNDFFVDLIKFNKNQILFEQYLKNNNL